jgi:omega-6 fatty acid desaturase (delta-12 desaturase)
VTSSNPDSATPAPETVGWKASVARFQLPSAGRAAWQLVNSVVPYALLWWAIHWSLGVSWWLTVPLAILASGFLVRIFIIFHDCGHGSFFRSRRANTLTGLVSGLLTLTPYLQWRWEHATHHGTSGDLDRRGLGDIWTLTVDEYLQASRWKRLAYRLARNPVILFFIAPLYIFVIHQRIPSAAAPPRERRSVHWMNLAIVAMALALSVALGVKEYVLIQLSITGIAGAAGIWMFYVQHQFEDTYWARGERWNYVEAALRGSSYYRLPRVLQWFTGNIGFHHIHHLNPRIPNYNLQRCHEAEPLFQQVRAMTVLASLRTLSMRLWDEQRQKLVGYRELRQRRRDPGQLPQT